MRLWAIAFLSGILFVQQLANLPSYYLVFVCLFVFVGFKPVRQIIQNHALLILLSGFVFGFSWALGHAHLMLSQRLLPQYEGVDLIIEGQVVSLPILASNLSSTSVKKKAYKQFHQQRVRFDFKPTKIISPANLVLKDFPEKIRLSWYRPNAMIEAGQLWHFKVRLKRPYALMNPGGFDYEQHLFQKRIQARGYIRDKYNNQLVKGYISSNYLRSTTLKLRQSILNKLSQQSDSSQHTENIRKLSQALILGYRGGLETSQWQTFQRTGTIHLMAISGLHIGLVAGLVYLFVGLLWRLIGRGCLWLPAPQIAAIAALLAAVLYAVLAGFTIPTQRALIMLCVAMLHIVFQRTPMPASKTISLALILVLLFDPLAVLAQGFWLSFLAVSVIIFMMRRPYKGKTNEDFLVIADGSSNASLLTKRLQNFLNRVMQFGRIQWALTIVMFPLVLYFYQSSSLVSPIANFIAIPIMSLVVVPLMFLATIFLYLNENIALAIFTLIDFIYGLLWRLLENLALWQYATIDNAIISVWLLVPCYLAILLWLAIKGTPMRWLAVVLVLPIIFSSYKKLDQGEAIITVLDVGQGLSTVVQTRNHVLVIDTGPKYSQNFDMGRAVIVPYLRHLGRSSIDRLIISHGDNDHIGGFKSIAALLPISKVLTSIPNEISHEGLDISACHVGQNWQYDGVQFSILSPISSIEPENGHDKNNQSCVLKVVTRHGRVLITGDIERETESYLYHSMPSALAAEVLVVPHHGSNTSSLTGFIKAVSPDFAVFTVGYKNRYKLPNKRVIKRYQQSSHAKLLHTSETGALTFYLQADKKLNPTKHRDLSKRYWHTQVVE